MAFQGNGFQQDAFQGLPTANSGGDPAPLPHLGLLLAASGSPDVTVSLNGQAVTSSAGTLGVSFSLPLTDGDTSQGLLGETVITSAGTLGVGFSKALAGQAATVSAGTLTPVHTAALSGQAATASAGTLATGSGIGLSGQAVTASAGTFTLTVTIGLTGQEATASAGTITYSAGSNLSLNLSGQAVSADTGTLTPSVTLSLSGQAATIAAGLVTPVSSFALTGQSGAFSAGSLTPSLAVSMVGSEADFATGTLGASGDKSVELSGEPVTVVAGILSASGGAAEGSNYYGGYFTRSELNDLRKKRKKRRYVEREFEQIESAVDREIAVLIQRQLNDESDKAEVQRLQRLAREYESVLREQAASERLVKAAQDAQHATDLAAFEYLSREIQRVTDEEDIAVFRKFFY